MEQEPIATTIMAAVSTSSHRRSRLSHSISSDLRRRHRRLSAVLTSPALFSQTIRRLLSLSLPAKSLLLARHLLSSLRLLLAVFLCPPAAVVTAPSGHNNLSLRDYDAVLLLLLLCDLRHHRPEALRSEPLSEWRGVLLRYFSDSVLSVSGLGASDSASVVEEAAQCWRLLAATGCDDGDGKIGRELAASPAAVVALPSVAVGDGAKEECAICREGMREGRDVCEMPCQHRFHWMCILPWVRKRNTCPCCRFRLPTDDVYAEIERLWDALSKIGGGEIRSDCEL